MDKKTYKDLLVWQKAIDFVPMVYGLLKSFPREENYALADQIRRAVISIPANIAEGQARTHRKEFCQFLAIAKGSLAELHTLLIVAHRLRYLTEEQLQIQEHAINEPGRLLNGLLNKLRD